jgi:hypothetical protein
LELLSAQEFQGDRADQFGVDRLVNNSHAACAELADDLVMGNGATDHKLSRQNQAG